MKVEEGSKKVGLKLNIQKTKIMSSGPITSWEIYGETVETVSDFLFWGSKITVDGDCSHEIKRHLLLGRKVMTNLDSIFNWRLLMTKLRKATYLLFSFPLMNMHKKLTNSEMEEMYRAKGEWRCVEPPFSEHSTLTIVFTTQKTLNPNISVLLRFQEIALLIVSLAIGDWFESQCPSLFPEVQKLHTFIVLNECWVLRNERWEFLYCMVIKLCSGNHHLTCERVNFKSFRRPTSWNRKRIKHE